MSYPPPQQPQQPPYQQPYPQQPYYPPPQVTVRVTGAGPNHVLHAVLTVCTCGLWLPVWIIVAIAGRRR